MFIQSTNIFKATVKSVREHNITKHTITITHVEPVITHQSEISEANGTCYTDNLTVWYANEAY